MAVSDPNLVPQVGPTRAQTPSNLAYLRVPSNLMEAAGVPVARAVQGLGGEIEKASNVVAQETLSLQNIENETWAKNQDVDMMIKLGQAQSEFDQKEGENAAKALPSHLDNIKKMRQDALDSAPNPMARKMLDQSISRRVAFAIVDSGHKAGTQMKAANKTAAGLRVEATRRSYDPSQVGSERVTKDTLEAEVEQLGLNAGLPRDAIDNVKQKELSRAYKEGIQRIYLTKPEIAQETFERVKDKMDPGDREAAQAWVNRGMASKQTRTDVDEIFTKLGFDPRKGPGQLTRLEDEGKKYIEKKGKDNPDYGHFLEGRIREKYNLGMAAHKDEQLGHEYSIGRYLLGENDQKRIVSIDGITGPNAPKEVRDAYTALEPPAQKRVLNWVNQMARGQANQWTPEKLAREKELRGMASDPEKALDFYNMGPDEIIKEGFPTTATRQLLRLQETVKTKAENVQLTQAMGVVGGMLESVGLTRTQNPRGYWQFRGAMEDQLRQFQGDKMVKVPPDEIRKIGSNLLREQGGFMGFFQTKMFQQSVPSEVADKIKAELIDKGYTPTDEMIQRTFAYSLYKQLYDKKEKGPAAPKADKGAAPDLQGLGQ